MINPWVSFLFLSFEKLNAHLKFICPALFTFTERQRSQRRSASGVNVCALLPACVYVHARCLYVRVRVFLYTHTHIHTHMHLRNANSSLERQVESLQGDLRKGRCVCMPINKLLIRMEVNVMWDNMLHDSCPSLRCVRLMFRYMVTYTTNRRRIKKLRRERDELAGEKGDLTARIDQLLIEGT